MKKHISIFAILTILPFPALRAQSCYKAAWVKDFGGNSLYQGVVDGDRRPDGQFVIAGSFSSADLTLGTVTLPAQYAYNYYLALHDSAGNFTAGSVISSGGTLSKIDVGPDGSVYVTGHWDGSIVIGNMTLPGAARDRIYLAKFTPDLQFDWVRVSSAMSADCYAYDVAVDLQQNVYVCGTFEDNAFKIGDFVVDNSGGWNLWSNEAFLVKFDSAGITQWVRSFGGPSDDAARTVTADSLGHVYVSGISGKTTSYVKFGDQLGIPGSVADNSGFLVRFDGTTGIAQWARMLGGMSQYDRFDPYDACLGDNNSLILSGSMSGTISLPPYTYTAADQNAFVARFNGNGDNEWLRQTGGQGTSEYGYYCFYHLGKVAVSGRLFSNQPYCGDFPLYSTLSGATFDAFNALFESDGSLVFARGNDGGSFSDYYPQIVLIDDAGNQLHWGTYKGTQTWYPVTKTNALSYGKTFLARFVPYGPAPVFSVAAGPDKTTTCTSPVQLSASTSPSSIPTGWWPNLGFSSNFSKTPTVLPGMPGSYIIYGTYQGCVKQDTVAVGVSDYGGFTIDAGPGQALCGDDSVQLTVNSNQTGLSYAWLPNKYINTATSGAPWVRPVLPIQYVVTATWNGCKAIDTVFVDQQGKPYIYLPKQDEYYSYGFRYHLCEGNPADIDLGDPANTYTVLSPALCSSISNNLITLHGNYPGGKLFVTAVSPEGCQNSDSVTIVIHDNLQAPVVLGSVPDRTACPGDSIEIYVWLTNSIQYGFQFSWYGGWQVDSLDGEGWKDISIWDKGYDVFRYSVGYPNSTYYTRLRIPVVSAGMDGFRYRCYISDYCSPAGFSNAGTLTIGPKLTLQPPALKTLCQNVTDSISVNSTSANVQYAWEILQAGNWIPLVPQPGVVTPNGRFLRFHNAQAGFDSTWVRCGLNGCNSSGPVYSNPSLIRVVPFPAVVWQTGYDTVCPGQNDSLMVTTNSNLFNYLWHANGVALTGNNSQISGYNTNKLRFTPVFSAQGNIDYTLKMSNLQCGYTAFSDTTGFRLIPVPTVTWPGNMIMTCVNASPVILSGATPPGGTYSGPGVTGNVFDPAVAGLGGHILTYTVNSNTPGCTAAALKSVFVQEPPAVAWAGGTVQLCNTSNNYALTGGTPNFGTYSGPGVTGNWFSPSSAGPGTHALSYTYLNPSTGCSNSATRTFTVGTTPVVSWPGGTEYFCLSSAPLGLSGGQPTGGTYSGTGVSGNLFDPSLAGIGSFTITYTVTDTVPICSGNASKTFVVTADPVANWPGGQLNYCIDDPADSCFGGMPAGGVYSGPGVLNNMFTPAVAGIGLHTITYTYTDPLTGCQDDATRLYYVDECTGLADSHSGGIRVARQGPVVTVLFPEPLQEPMNINLYTLLGQLEFSAVVPWGTDTYTLILKPGQSMRLLSISGQGKKLAVKITD